MIVRVHGAGKRTGVCAYRLLRNSAGIGFIPASDGVLVVVWRSDCFFYFSYVMLPHIVMSPVSSSFFLKQYRKELSLAYGVQLLVIQEYSQVVSLSPSQRKLGVS